MERYQTTLWFRRDWEPRIQARVVFTTREQVTVDQCLQALKQAVTQWVGSSKEAQEFYLVGTSEDLSIGDLLNEDVFPHLTWEHAPWLIAVQAESMRLNTGDAYVPYDTRLCEWDPEREFV